MLRRLVSPLTPSLPARFDVPGSGDEGVRLLSNALGPAWFPLTRRPLVGAVLFGSVYVRRNQPWVRNAFAPIFHGAFQTEAGRTVLAGRFRMRWFVRVFMLVWFSGLGLFMGVAISQLFSAPTQPLLKLWFLVVPLGMAAAGLGLVHLGWRAGEPDIKVIMAGIRDALHRHGT